jgi:ABC-type multidrug transport system fused ATPase/permease subunit
MISYFWGILTPRERRRGGTVLALILLAGLSEAMGFGAVIPFIVIATDPARAMKNAYLAPFVGTISTVGYFRLLSYAAILLIAAFIFKNLVILYSQYYQNRFCLNVGKRISTELFNNSLRRKFKFYSDTNIAIAVKDLTVEVSHACEVCLYNFLILVSESATMACMITLMFVVNWRVTSIMAVGSVPILVTVGLLVNYRSKVAGIRLLKITTSRIKLATEAISGLKELKVLGRENFFQRRFENVSADYALTSTQMNTLTSVPRMVIEVGGVVGVACIILWGWRQTNSINSILPILTVYVVSASRLIPSTSRVMIATSRIKGFLPSLKKIIALLNETPDRLETSVPTDPASIQKIEKIGFSKNIVLEDIHFHYSADSTKKILNGLSLEFSHGSSTGIVGLSGAGKSTLIDVLLGLYSPVHGKFLVDGTLINESNVRTWRHNIGYVPQAIYLADDTIAGNIAFGCEESDEKQLWEAIELAQMSDFVRGLPNGINTIVGDRGVKISGGQRQRLGIARALYHRPEILIFDEATSSLDNLTEKYVSEAIHNLRGNKTLIIVAHRLSTVQSCDKIIVLDSGRVTGIGAYQDLQNTNSLFRSLVEHGGKNDP